MEACESHSYEFVDRDAVDHLWSLSWRTLRRRYPNDFWLCSTHINRSRYHCSAVFAYLYAGLSVQQIDLLGASQLVGYPTQFPSVTLLNWNTGAPNARYRVLEMLHENFGPGDAILRATTSEQGVVAAAYISRGLRKILLINQRSTPNRLRIPTWKGAEEEHVSLDTGNSIRHYQLTGESLHLGGYSVMIVTYPN